MSDEECRECIYWYRKGRIDTGECRRYPPIAQGIRPADLFYWPHTEDIDWCGEFKKRAT